MVHGFDLFFSLFNNLAIFIALVAVYRFMFGQFRHAKWFNRQFVLGVSFGIFAIGCMYAKIPVFKGVLVDQRNAVVALSGIFGGPLSAVISATFAGSYRVYLGGDGVLGGVIGVCLSALAGTILHARSGSFASMGRAASCSLFATILILPGFLFIGDIWVGLRLLQAMALPYGLAVFSGIFLVGLLLNREEERHAIEQSFLESERKYRELVEGTEELITHVDGDGKYTFVNHVAGRILGSSPKECVGMSASRFIHPDDRERTQAWFEECVAKRRLQATIENRQVNARTGEARHVNWSASFHYDASGALVGAGSFARDVTERRLAEAALAASEERLSLALDAANDGLWDWDVASGRTYFSPRYSTMLGYAPGEITGEYATWRSLLHPDDLERVEAQLSSYQAGKAPAYEAEFRMRGKDGGWRWILSRGKAVDRDPEGRTMRMVGTHVDITARKGLELRLADQLAFQQALMDTIPYAVFYKGADTRFLGFNTAYEEMFGIRREDLLGKRVLDLDYLPAADRAAYQAEDEAVIASGGRVQKEMPIPFADGRVHQTLYSVSGFRQADGSPGGLIGLIVDISERKQAEVALAASEERFAKAFNSSPAPLVIVEIETGRFIAVNDRWVEMLGYTREEQVGRTSFEVGIWVDPDDRGRAMEILARDGVLKDYPVEFRAKTGQVRSTLWSVEVINLEGKDVLLSLIVDITERKQAEAALAASEEKYRFIFDTTPVGIFRSSFSGRVLDANPTLVRMLGYASLEEARACVTDLAADIYPRPAERRRMLDALLASPDGVKMEIEFKRKDGSPFYAIINSSLQFDAAGNPASVSGTVEDITQRRLAEEALRLSEEKFSRLFLLSPDNVALSDMDTGRFVEVNESFLRYHGLTREEVIGRKAAELNLYVDIRKRRQLVEALQARGVVENFEVETRRGDGTVGLGSMSAQLVEIEGRPHVLSILRDITGIKQAEAAIRQSEEKFSRLFRLSPDSVILTDMESGLIVDVNETFVQRTGYSREEVVGRTSKEIGLFSDDARRDAFWNSIRNEGHVENYEFEIRHRDGKVVVCSLSAQSLELAGKPHLLSIARDITETRKMQEMMVQTEKMISVGGIAAGIAHEINNPLGIVLQATQNLVRRLKPDLPKNIEAAQAIGLDLGLVDQYLRARKLDVFIDDIQSAAVRAAAIIRHMLDFSRRSESRRMVCDLPGIVRKAIDLAQTDYDLKKSFDFKRIQIGMEIGDDLPDINCTETEIEQVILNLLRNAAQAMATAEPPVADPRIAIRLSGQPGGVRIEVEDNGPGIPPEVQRRIFEPFFTTKAPGVGTGLGLSVSYFIVTKGHGGMMKVESTPGEGARFIIELPTEDART